MRRSAGSSTSGLYVRLGAQNLFDKTPSDNPWGGIAGAAVPGALAVRLQRRLLLRARGLQVVIGAGPKQRLLRAATFASRIARMSRRAGRSWTVRRSFVPSHLRRPVTPAIAAIRACRKAVAQRFALQIARQHRAARHRQRRRMRARAAAARAGSPRPARPARPRLSASQAMAIWAMRSGRRKPSQRAISSNTRRGAQLRRGDAR